MNGNQKRERSYFIVFYRILNCSSSNKLTSLEMIFNLPDFIFDNIQVFLNPRSVHDVPQMVYNVKTGNRLLGDVFVRDTEEDKAWRNLMNTTKRAAELKRKTIYIVL